MMKIGTFATHRRALAVALAAFLLALTAGVEPAHGQRGRDDDRRAASPARAAAPARPAPSRAARPPARQAAPARAAERRPAPARTPTRAAAPPSRQAAPPPAPTRASAPAPSRAAVDRTPRSRGSVITAPSRTQRPAPTIVTRPGVPDTSAPRTQRRIDLLREQQLRRPSAATTTPTRAPGPADEARSRSMRIETRNAPDADRASARQRLIEILNQPAAPRSAAPSDRSGAGPAAQAAASMDERRSRDARPSAAPPARGRATPPPQRSQRDRPTRRPATAPQRGGESVSEAASQAQRDNRAAANVRTRESRSEQLVQQAQERDAARAARMRDRNQSPTLPPLQQPSTRRGAAQSPAQAASSQEPATRRDLHIQRREAASASRAAASRTRTPLSEYTHPSAAAGASNSNASSVHNRSNVSNVSNVSNTSSASKVSNVSNVTNVTNISNVSNVSNVSSVTNLSTFSGSKFHQPSFFLPPHKKSPLFLASHKPKTSLFFGIGSGKTSFFFSYSSSPLFFKPKHAWYPTWSHWHGSSWSWWAWHKPYHSWCPWWSHPHTSLRWTTWPRTTILHTHTYSVLPTTHVIYQPATTVVSKPKPIVIEQPACPYTHREAWEFLAQGPSHLDQAVDAFTCLAQEHPYDGITVVGLSLATARAGDFDKAAQLMRFAARVDVESLRHVPADRRIDDIIVDLVGAYSQLMHAPAREIDALFMIAALRTILHDAGGAHFTIGQAIQKGDEDASAFALRDLLVKLLSEELFPGP